MEEVSRSVIGDYGPRGAPGAGSGWLEAGHTECRREEWFISKAAMVLKMHGALLNLKQ
jgi:hypothetical protein